MPAILTDLSIVEISVNDPSDFPWMHGHLNLPLSKVHGPSIMSTMYCRRVAEDNVDDCERRCEDEDGGVEDSDSDEEEIESMMGMYAIAPLYERSRIVGFRTPSFSGSRSAIFSHHHGFLDSLGPCHAF